jgi:asparagine synthase (glutamine-hydrolysing)
VRDVDDSRASAPHTPRPYGRLIGQALTAPLRATIERTATQACFDGIGGDAVFGFLASASPAADRLLRQGPLAAVASVADIASQTGASVGTIAYRAVRRAWFQSRSYDWRGDDRFLAGDLTHQSHAGPLHPWLTAPRGAAPSSAARIAMVMRATVQAGNSGRPDAPPMISPLLSQPVVELCLSIPSWRWCEGGRDRAIARQAFASDLPREIIARRSKGGAEAFCYDVLEANRSLLRDRLLGGELARHGIIDRRALEPILTSPAPPPANLFLRLLDLAEAEAWAEAWR